MYRRPLIIRKAISKNDSKDGESIEKKMNRITNNKEPITDGAELIYTDRKDGTPAGFDIRTDRWEIAIDAMDKVNKDRIARREAFTKDLEKKNEPNQGEPTKPAGDTGGVTSTDK